MKVSGIVCEYNPFHSGHEYQIKKTKEHADAVVAIMSGSFTQRGEPALFDKWTRAQAAVLCGVNLVIELPFFAACAPAEYFARTAVKILASMGMVNTLSFGSECGNIDELVKIALADENSYEIKKQLDSGASYSKAVAAAFGEDMFTPNNILAIEYIRAINEFAPQITPFTVKRQGESYESENTGDGFISASGCRRLILEDNLKLLQKYVPKKAYDLFEKQIKCGNYCEYKNLDALFTGLLRRDGQFLKNIAYVSEGLQHRFYKAAKTYTSISDIADSVKSKRYTRARINRIIANAITGITKDMSAEFLSANPQYIRVLAADNTGLALLKNVNMPIITNASQANVLTGIARQMWDAECTVTDIYTQCIKNPQLRCAGQDYTHFFVKV